MPRPRFSVAATPLRESPMKIPLNDDEQEKANRRRQRNALQEAQEHSIRFSATPARRRISQGANGSPHTPSNDAVDLDEMPDVVGTAVTPMKQKLTLNKVDFENYIKLTTDNKINAANAWTVELIEYFADMRLLKEGDGVNFQKASVSLDGCVKIYTSRVESVATDTGKLLSGLAESKEKKRRGDDAEEEDEDGEDENGQKKKKKRAQRSAENTIVEWSKLRNDKMELELSVDPLFKKASADFDEGGAKGLLLNHLAIDAKGRIVFDSSDDANDISAEHRDATPAPEEADEANAAAVNESVEIDIARLGQKFFPDLSMLDSWDVCPSLKTFNLVAEDGSVNLPPGLRSEDLQQDESTHDDEDDEEGECDRSGMVLDDDNPMGFDDGIVVADIPEEVGFGEGGEAWARDAAIQPQLRVHNMGDEDAMDGAGDGEFGAERDEQENILNYFDNALKKNDWAGPEHWRIRRIKDVDNAPPPAKRKEKEPFSIDFAGPMTQDMANAIYETAKTASTITLKKEQRESKTRYLLPEDKHFNSNRLLYFFLKPNARPRMRHTWGRNAYQQRRPQSLRNQQPDQAIYAEEAAALENTVVQGDYNADAYQDHGFGEMGAPFDDDDDFEDAREHLSPAPGVPGEEMPGQTEGAGIDGVIAGAPEGAYGSQVTALGRRFRPEYIQFARKAKKVDIRRLKENLWRGMPFEQPEAPPTPAADPDAMDIDKNLDEATTFTSMINGLQERRIYPKQEMDDISTSYCFICLLHLANEKGLVIENQDRFEDLAIRKDYTADLSGSHD